MGRYLRTATVLLCVPGLVFIGQGTGLLRGSSFMVDDTRWAWIGAAMLIVGLALGAVGWRRGRA